MGGDCIIYLKIQKWQSGVTSRGAIMASSTSCSMAGPVRIEYYYMNYQTKIICTLQYQSRMFSIH